MSYPLLKPAGDKVKAEVLDDLPLVEEYKTALITEVEGRRRLPEKLLRSLQPDQLLDQVKVERLKEKYKES